MKTLYAMLLAALLLVTAGACAKTPGTLKKEAGGEVVHGRFAIKAGGTHEECVELRPGMAFEYEYDATAPLTFNIHYHADDKVHYPVQLKGRSFGKGRVDPETHPYYTEEQEFYCLMWENANAEPVDVSYKCMLKQKAVP